MFDQLAIQAVSQQVDGGIHVGMFRFGNQIVAGNVQGTFGLLLKLVHLQSDLNADDLVEMPLEAGHLFGNVITQCVGDIELKTSDVHLHNTSPDWLDNRSTIVGDSMVPLLVADFIDPTIDSDQTFPLAGWRYVEGLAVFGDGPSRDMDALFLK